MTTELNVLGAQIRQKNAALQLSLKRSVNEAIELGDLLMKAKVSVGHGNFMRWVESNGVAERSARRYMELAEYKAKTARVADLTTAYALIAELKAQKKEVEKAVDAEIITPEQARELEPGPEYADKFLLKRQEIKDKKRKNRKDGRQTRSDPVSGPCYDNEETVRKLIAYVSHVLNELPDNTRRLEACHDLIKYLRVKVNEYQFRSANNPT